MTTLQSTSIDGTATLTAGLTAQSLSEKTAIVPSAATGTLTLNALTQSIVYYNVPATANWILNIRGDASNTLNSVMAIGESLTITTLVVNGPIAYYPTALQIDGTTTSARWLGRSAPTNGNSNTVDSYSYTVIKTANSTYTVLASAAETGFGDLGEEFGLYSFARHTFTTAGVSGRFGPTLSQVRAAYSTQPWAQNTAYLNMTVQGIQRWAVPISGTYRITAAGACGSGYGAPSNNRGYGAVIRGDFRLTAGWILEIAVGQAGTGNGGGGGGTFVVREVTANNHQPLIIAGAGGGIDVRYPVTPSYHDASYTINGNPGGGGYGTGGIAYNGGTNGQGGQDGGANGGAGGGFFSNGGVNPGTFGGYGLLFGGNAPTTNSLVGGAPDTDGNGGFGGGGGSSDDQGAGGGGYSGGGGTSEDEHGGGGGSFNSGTNQTNLTYNTAGPGYVIVERIA
jgi:hypothetical protein